MQGDQDENQNLEQVSGPTQSAPVQKQKSRVQTGVWLPKELKDQIDKAIDEGLIVKGWTQKVTIEALRKELKKIYKLKGIQNAT